MIDEPDLVTLFYRADWTRISLSAEVHELSDWALRSKMLQPAHPGFSWVRVDVPPDGRGRREHRARLRIAPGGRYVVGILTSSDAQTPPDHDAVLRTRYGIRPGLLPPYPEVLRPSLLLVGFSLELAERVQVAGRAALRDVATPPLASGRPIGASGRNGSRSSPTPRRESCCASRNSLRGGLSSSRS